MQTNEGTQRISTTSPSDAGGRLPKHYPLSYVCLLSNTSLGDLGGFSAVARHTDGHLMKVVLRYCRYRVQIQCEPINAEDAGMIPL